MSFFSDLFHGNFSNLGTDITHAPESLAKHPSELYETLGGAAALATGGLALGGLGIGGLGALGGAEAAGGGILTGGDALGIGAGDYAAASLGTDAYAAGSAGDLATAESLAGGGQGGNLAGYGFGSDFLGVAPNTPTVGLNDFGPLAGGGGGDITGSTGGLAGVGGGGGAPTAGGFQLGSPSTWLPAAGLTPAKAAGVAIGAGALGYDVLKGQKPLADQSALQSQATQLSAQGQQFMSYLQQGKLPAGLQTLVDKQTQAAKAMAISNAAKNGQSTDPTTNTQLADAINSAQQQATAQVAQLGEQLFKQGLDETQVSAQIMQYLTNLDEQQTANMGKSIAAFAASLAGGGIGGGGGQTFKLAAA